MERIYGIIEASEALFFHRNILRESIEIFHCPEIQRCNTDREISTEVKYSRFLGRRKNSCPL